MFDSYVARLGCNHSDGVAARQTNREVDDFIKKKKIKKKVDSVRQRLVVMCVDDTKTDDLRLGTTKPLGSEGEKKRKWVLAPRLLVVGARGANCSTLLFVQRVTGGHHAGWRACFRVLAWALAE